MKRIMKKKLILNKRDFKKILNAYSIGKYKSHKKMWWSLGNDIYYIKTDKEEIILKIFGDHNLKRKLEILQIIEKLREKTVPIPKTYKDKNGSLIHDYKGKHLVVQEFVKGDGRPIVNQNYSKELAMVLGPIDKNLMKIKYFNVKSSFNYQFKRSSYRSDDIIMGFDYKSAEESVLSEVNKTIDKKKLRKGIIHSDFASSNLIFKKGKILAVLDWDNLRKDYLVSEPAIALGHIITLHKEVKLNLVRIFLNEYEKHVMLNNEERKAVYYFIKNKILGGIVWCDLQRKAHPSKAKTFKKWLISLIDFYKKFDQISLDNFLKAIH